MVVDVTPGDAPHGSVAASLDDLAAIGATADGGVTRVAWSPELFDAYRWAEAQLASSGSRSRSTRPAT